MKKIISTIILAVLLAVPTFAGNENAEVKSKEANTKVEVTNVNIKGTVMDLKNNETLAGATILVDGKKFYSDLEGNFNLYALTPGKHSISVEMISYNNSEMEIEVQKDTDIKIKLVQK